MFVASCSALLVSLFAGCAQPPSRVTRVLVVSSGGSNDAVDGVQSAIVARDNLALEDVSRLAALASEQPTAEQDLEALADPHLVRASEAFSRFDYTGATSALNEALAVLRPTARSSAGRRRLAEIHLRLALVLLVHEERAAALEEVRTCLHLSAACAPDPAVHPPELVALHQEAREDSEGRGALQIDTEPVAAEVSLDGVDGRPGPAEWNDVPSGRHYVAVESDGFRPLVEVVPVRPGGTTERRVVLALGTERMRASAALRAVQREGAEAELRWRIDTLALGDADALLVVEPDRVTVFDARGAPIVARERPSDRRDAARFIDAAFQREARFYEKWWFWTPLSLAVAAALATGVFFAVRTRDVRLVGGDTVRE